MKASHIVCAWMLLIAACGDDTQEPSTPDAGRDAGDASASVDALPLSFVPDPGIRIDHATNAWAAVEERADGTQRVYLWFSDRMEAASGPAMPAVIVSEDGLSFDRSAAVDYQSPRRGVSEDIIRNDPRYKLMPAEEDGGPVWRRFNATPEGLTTETSSDGISFLRDDGYVYTYHNEGEGYENDNGLIGYNDVHPTPDGRLVFTYIGDMQPDGYNNVRMAISTDNGRTFLWEKANVLDDARLVDEGGHQACAYVDPKPTVLPDGRIWYFLMTQDCMPPAPEVGRSTGYIHSFLAEDGVNFVHDEGIRLQPSDFDWDTFGFVVYSLNDPTVVRLTDGRYRMYVTARICESQTPADCTEGGAGDMREALVSATATP